MFNLILTQTLTHAFRKGGGAFGVLAFYVMVMTLFTFAVGPEGMQKYAAAIMATAMLLSSLIALPMLYERDFEDGTLEQFLLQPTLLEFIVLAKIIGQWLAMALPILLITPLVGIMANIPMEGIWQTAFFLLLASPSMVAIGSIAAALTIGTRRGGLLQSLIVLPLYIPILIFAAASSGQGVALLLAAILFGSLPIACWVSAALIRAAQD